MQRLFYINGYISWWILVFGNSLLKMLKTGILTVEERPYTDKMLVTELFKRQVVHNFSPLLMLSLTLFKMFGNLKSYFNIFISPISVTIFSSANHNNLKALGVIQRNRNWSWYPANVQVKLWSRPLHHPNHLEIDENQLPQRQDKGRLSIAVLCYLKQSATTSKRYIYESDV